METGMNSLPLTPRFSGVSNRQADRGYGVFSVSHSGVAEVSKYIADQAEHHRKKSYLAAFKLFVERYGLEWRDDENR